MDTRPCGKLGMFVIGLCSKHDAGHPVPYNLPMFSLVIYASLCWK
jgi:hypothetical protein